MPSRKSSDVVFFVALLSTALALGGPLAHLYELPNKIGLPRDEYFVVQSIYAGWNRLAYLLAVELVSILALIVMFRRQRQVLWPGVVAFLGLAAAQAIFWIYTYPANVATSNWTVIPDNWEVLRRNWEFSHAAGAPFHILTMIALIVAVLVRSRSDEASQVKRR
jgi:hypothetical protein